MCEKALSTYAKAPSKFPKAPLQELQGYVGIFQEITDDSNRSMLFYLLLDLSVLNYQSKGAETERSTLATFVLRR